MTRKTERPASPGAVRQPPLSVCSSMPGGQGDASGGEREVTAHLARAAVAVGVDSVFFEVHDAPDRAPCDGPIQYPLDEFPALVDDLLALDRVARASR